MSPEREHPNDRRHETYEQEHWKVLDVDGVDKVFATPSNARDSDRPTVRIDLDGEAAASVMRDLADEGDNVNLSVWLELPDAAALRDQLTEALESARDGE